MLFLTLLWALALHVDAQQSNVPIVPSNTSSYATSTNTVEQLVLGLPITPAGANDPFIYALTSTAASLPPRDPKTQNGIGDHLWNTNPSTSKNISAPGSAIAYISCDAQGYSGGNIGLSEVLDDAINANVTSVLFYSGTQDFCVVNGTLSGSQTAFGRYFTMTSTADAMRVSNSISGMLASSSNAAEIMTQQAYNNVLNAGQGSQGIDNTPSTAVAMIILYSITGVITALFLVIIITGAVRAHRHPERYGPRNVLGRPRQSRAKGIARAMLETIPIVKFGEKPQPKSEDVELGEATSSRAAQREAEEHSDEAQGQSATRAEHADASLATPRSTDDTTAASPAGDGTSPTTGGPVGNDASCSICTEDFQKGEDLRVLPCDHKFHAACVDPWLLDVSGTCPLCRVDLRPKEEQTSGEGNEQENQRGSQEGEPLPPPLSQGRNRRRDTILNFLDRRRMQDSNPEERISALRRWRQASRRSSRMSPQEGAGEASGQNSESSNQEQR